MSETLTALTKYLGTAGSGIGNFVKNSPEYLLQGAGALATPFSPTIGSALGATGVATQAYKSRNADQEYADLLARKDAIQRGETQRSVQLEPSSVPDYATRRGGEPQYPRSSISDDPLGESQTPLGMFQRSMPARSAGLPSMSASTIQSRIIGPKPLTLQEALRVQKGPPSSTAEFAKAGLGLATEGAKAAMNVKLERDKSFREAMKPVSVQGLMQPLQRRSGGTLTTDQLVQLLMAFQQQGRRG